MSFTLHEVIVVTSWNDMDIERAHAKAVEMELPVTGIIHAPVNMQRTFMIGPDGSKEGWEDADRFEQIRAVYIEWLMMNRYVDGSSSVDFVLVQWGEDDDKQADVATVKSRAMFVEERRAVGSYPSGD